GFDGITMSRYCVPVMTTIVQPSEQIALQSVELLVRQIEHGAPAQTVTLQPDLQQGETYSPAEPFLLSLFRPHRRITKNHTDKQGELR
ncbi:transcriptional regulator, partial [gut metagenome]